MSFSLPPPSPTALSPQFYRSSRDEKRRTEVTFCLTAGFRRVDLMTSSRLLCTLYESCMYMGFVVGNRRESHRDRFCVCRINIAFFLFGDHLQPTITAAAAAAAPYAPSCTFARVHAYDYIVPPARDQERVASEKTCFGLLRCLAKANASAGYQV